MSNEKAVRQLEGIARSFRAMAVRDENVAIIWPRVGNLIARSNREQFATRGAFYGTPWKPLSPRTIADKLKHGYGRQMLVRSGALKLEFTGRPMALEVYSSRSARFGSRSKLSVWQQRGTHHNGRRHIPPRTIQKINREMANKIRQMTVAYVVKGKVTG
jgi:hypothetical protein